MKLLKRIIINIYENGESTIEEDIFDYISEELNEDKDIVREITTVTKSWNNYNLIIYSKKSKLFKELLTKENNELKIKFDGKYFYGKIDSKNARIYGLKDLIKYSQEENLVFTEDGKVELIYSKAMDMLNVNIIK